MRTETFRLRRAPASALIGLLGATLCLGLLCSSAWGGDRARATARTFSAQTITAQPWKVTTLRPAERDITVRVRLKTNTIHGILRSRGGNPERFDIVTHPTTNKAGTHLLFRLPVGRYELLEEPRGPTGPGPVRPATRVPFQIDKVRP